MLSSEKIFLNYSERMRILLYYTAAVACKFFQSSVLIKILFLFYFFIYLLYTSVYICTYTSVLLWARGHKMHHELLLSELLTSQNLPTLCKADVHRRV